jgi:hypothetical protein
MLKVDSLSARATSATQRSALSQFFADMFAGRGLTRQDVTRAALTGLPLEPEQKRH